jgi:hypothetical protein
MRAIRIRPMRVPAITFVSFETKNIIGCSAFRFGVWGKGSLSTKQKKIYVWQENPMSVLIQIVILD